MVILGIDLGIAEMGWGVVQTQKSRGKNKKRRIKYVNHGVIKTLPTDPLSERLWTIKSEIERLLTGYDVEEVAVERIVFNINRKTAIIVAKVHGAVLVAAGKCRVPTYEYNALKAKRLLTGYGRADKKLVQLELKKKFRLKKYPTPVHAADALAIACCHIMKDDEA